MPIVVVAALGFHAAALALLLNRLRRRVLSHIGAVYILAMVLYHGVCEVVQRAFPNEAKFRALTQPGEIEDFALLMGGLTLLFTVVYLATLSGSPPERAGDSSEATRFFDWRVLTIAILPLFVATALGKGLAPSTDPTAVRPGVARQDYVASGLSAQFLILGLALLGFVLIARSEGRWFLPVLIGTTAACAVVGQRSFVVTVAVLVVYALARHGIRPSQRQVRLAALLVVVSALVISAARIEGGRRNFSRGRGPIDRVSSLLTGVTKLHTPEARRALIDDYVYRLDGNAYGSLLLRGLNEGRGEVGTETLENNVALAVPSFLNPSKLATTVADRSEKEYIKLKYGLPRYVDFLPTQLGVTVAYWGPWGTTIISILFAAALAGADRWLRGGGGPVRLLAALGLLSCVLSYESSTEVYLLTLRGVVLLIGAAAAANFLHVVARRSKQRFDSAVQVVVTSR